MFLRFQANVIHKKSVKSEEIKFINFDLMSLGSVRLRTFGLEIHERPYIVKERISLKWKLKNQ